MTPSRKISLIDVTLRDAHQRLWATRMTTAMMSELAPILDRAGFEATIWWAEPCSTSACVICARIRGNACAF